MLAVQGLTMRYGSRVLFEEVTTTFSPGRRYGLTGPNGAGKSTFMKILAGELEQQTGSVQRPRRMGILRQDQFAFDAHRVIDTVIMSNQTLWKTLQERDALYAKPEMSDEDGMRVAELEGIVADEDGYTAESDAAILLQGSWGGSRIEPWWAEEGLEGVEALADLRKTRLAKCPGFPEYDKQFRKYVADVRSWSDEAGKALDAGLPVPEMPQALPQLSVGSGAETGTYQAMIHPLVPYALRGFIWYQGESNNGEGMLYTAKKQALIQGWRKQFRAPEAPFLFVQLAPYNYGENRTFDLPGIWWAQQETLKIPHTGMAVINDIGMVGNIHPTNKTEVARRLALWAFADTYGKTNIVKSGPLFSGYKVTDQGIAIRFEHIGGGLTTRDGNTPTWFEIAGSDGTYQQAEAKISGDGKWILLTSVAVPKPDRARFAWSQVAEPNLMNKEGLPAAAFNTHWPSDPTLGHKISGGKPHVSSHPNTHGWSGGVTDGTWGENNVNCYATDESPTFPKTVTVDLGAAKNLHAVLYGVPGIGSTKTVAVSISEDGQTFTEVGRTEFPAKKATGADAKFPPRKARYVRATFVDHYPPQDAYSENFGFLSELEAYEP